MRSYKLYLRDIAEAMEAVERFVEGMDLEEFRQDDKTSSAVIKKFEIIGEATNRLPDEFKEAHSDIERYKIVGLRHRIVHEYFGVDLQIIWQIVRKDLPELRANLSRI